MSKICNKCVKVESGMSLNDKDMCLSLLSSLKDMEKNYCIAMTEASNEWLYDVYKDMFLTTSSLQRELFLLMFRRGWYVLENVSKAKIDEKIKELSLEYEELGL